MAAIPGTPSEAGLLADGAAALDFLGGEGIAPNRLVIYGESLGSGVAVPLAAQREVASADTRSALHQRRRSRPVPLLVHPGCRAGA